jgi:hypothetical protein
MAGADGVASVAGGDADDHGVWMRISEMVGPSDASRILRRKAVVVTGSKEALKCAPSAFPLWNVVHEEPSFF